MHAVSFSSSIQDVSTIVLLILSLLYTKIVVSEIRVTLTGRAVLSKISVDLNSTA